MNVTEARANVKTGALQTNSFTDSEVDYAIQVTCNDFCNYTGVLITPDTVTIAADATTVSLAGGDFSTQEFRPAFFENARIGNKGVKRVDYDWVRRRLEAYPNKKGRPEYLGFEDISIAAGSHIFPTADVSYTLSVTWHPRFQDYTIGGDHSVELAIPERYIHRALWEGCAAMLVYGEATNNPWPTTGWQRYLAYREEVRRMAPMTAGLPKPNPYTLTDQPTAAAPTQPEPATAQG